MQLCRPDPVILTWEDRTVSIYGGVCDTADRCGITHCKFYDVSPAGDAKFKRGLAHEHTLEGLLERMANL